MASEIGQGGTHKSIHLEDLLDFKLPELAELEIPAVHFLNVTLLLKVGMEVVKAVILITNI
ncbi:hypothetical protein [Pseudomonas fluorescens]|uniref:hypothetical protein n=1 Tax=Pseudomonas fluorescens TaxID=294 RepID=UPI001240CF7F|nr:hypothetical protein [Pseudomonas fluorescens]